MLACTQTHTSMKRFLRGLESSVAEVPMVVDGPSSTHVSRWSQFFTQPSQAPQNTPGAGPFSVTPGGAGPFSAMPTLDGATLSAMPTAVAITTAPPAKRHQNRCTHTPHDLTSVCNFGGGGAPSHEASAPSVRAKRSDRADWFLRHTDDARVDDALAGYEFNDAGTPTLAHTCTCLQVDGPGKGMPCHVGLYGWDHAVARENCRKLRRQFLEPTRPMKERGREVYDAMHLPDDGHALGERPPIICQYDIEVQQGQELGILVKSQSDEEGEDIHTIVQLYGQAKLKTALRCDDTIVATRGVCIVDGVAWSATGADGVPDGVQITVQRQPPQATGMIYKIGRRRVCRSVFQQRYPVSSPSLYRFEQAKREEAADAYANREKQLEGGNFDSNKGLRGSLCVAWLLKYVEFNCERIPDIAMRLLPCRKLADMWREYTLDTKAATHGNAPVQLDQFRRLFRNAPEMCDCRISDSKRNFGKCATCRKGEMRIRKASKGNDPEELAAAKFDRYQHLMGLRMEKVSYYFEREMSRSPVALKVSLIIDKVRHPPTTSIASSADFPCSILNLQMDSNKNYVPCFSGRLPKDITPDIADNLLCMHVVGVIVHGNPDRRYFYLAYPHLAGDSSTF